MATVTEPKVVDLDALERDLVERVRGLNAERQKLALDALSDDGARMRLLHVEAEIADSEAELQRVGLARVEQESRDAVVRAAEVSKAQAAALLDARRLQVDRDVATRGVDECADRFVATVAKYAAVCAAQQRKLLEAGRSGAAHAARVNGFGIEGTLARAWVKARSEGDVPNVFDRLPMIPMNHQRLLVETDARVVEPLAGRRDAESSH